MPNLAELEGSQGNVDDEVARQVRLAPDREREPVVRAADDGEREQTGVNASLQRFALARLEH